LHNISITWLIRAKLTMGNRNFILQRSRIWKRGNWSHRTQVFHFFCLFFICHYSIQYPKKILGWKNIGGPSLPPPPRPPSYAYAA
jgi:hypothetical protein